MITLAIGVVLGCSVSALLRYACDFGWGWSVALGVVAFTTFQVLTGLLFRKKVMADMQAVQAILAEGQKKIQAKMARWQFRPPGSIQAAQKEIADDTRIFVEEALARCEELDKYRHWVPMIARQKATAQLQLSWMIKDFKRVDALMDKALFIDPTMVAMKIARMQMTDCPVAEIRKVYERAVRRLKYNQNVLLAAAYSWILVKRGMSDEAFKALTEALKHSDNETLKRNHEQLMNNRVAHFSNSGIGEQWYSLMLEEPKIRQQRQRSVYR